MPRYKRYGPLSHDINRDSDVWEFTLKFGDRSIRTLLEVLMIIDRCENHWRLSGDWSGNLSRTVRQSVANVRRQIRHMVATGWLLVEESAPDGSPLVLSAAKYQDYHRKRETKKPTDGTTTGNKKGNSSVPTILSYPILNNSSPNGEEEKPPAQENSKSENDLGLGDRHPGNLCGWELWQKLEAFWREKQKRLGIYQLELIGKQLGELKAQGHDPAKVVEKALRRGWMDLRALDDDEIEKRFEPVVQIKALRERILGPPKAPQSSEPGTPPVALSAKERD
ncbi:MAG TPA: hypothetical protein VEG60_34510 [Candidatus Binatia bacterium]|nr:hypothetical protein [Candidatus Binatia bacterium]